MAVPQGAIHQGPQASPPLHRACDRPVRLVLGVTTLAFYVVLQLAASNDLIALWLGVSVATITWIFRITVLVLPPLVGYCAYRLMKGLQVSRAERFSTVPLDAVLHAKRYEAAPEHEGAEVSRPR